MPDSIWFITKAKLMPCCGSAKTWLLAAHAGPIQLTHSEHVCLREQGRIDYDFATDDDAHGIAGVIKRAPKMSPDQLIIAKLSGRGDKDVSQNAGFLLEGKEP